MDYQFLLVFLLLGSILIFLSCLFLGIFLVRTQRRRVIFSAELWHKWKESVEQREDEKWENLLRRAGQPFRWGKAEWLAAQWVMGLGLFVLVITLGVISSGGSFPLLSMVIIPSIGFFLPYLALKYWADYREELLSIDIARFINRYVTLVENGVPTYQAMVKASRPTKKLKQYLPPLSEWNRDRFAALEKFKRDLGVEDAIILVSNLRTIELIPTTILASTMQRLEWTVDNRRMFRHRKKIKSLGIAYSIIVYPAFYIGLIVAMFPWYKLLTEILDKYLL